jgi:transcriptional regulator with XRE-family HTH domain
MNISDQINEIIKNTIKQKKISQSKLAEMLDLSPQYVGQLFNGKRRWNAETQDRAFEVLNISATIKVNRK